MTYEFVTSIHNIITSLATQAFLLQAFFPAICLGIAIKKFKNIDD